MSAEPRRHAGPPRPPPKTVGRGVMFIGFAKIYFMLTGFAQRFLLTRLIGAADFGDFAIVNNFVSIINNTVVQGTIQGVSKLTAEDDARAGAVQRAGLRLQAGAGAAAGAGAVRRRALARGAGSTRRASRPTSASPP